MKYNSILISGLPGSGKSTLSRSLAEKLNWKHYSIGDILREEWKKNKTNLSFEDYWKTLTVEENRDLNTKAREIIKEGNVVGDFRYSICCKDLPALTVFITAGLYVRAERNITISDKNIHDISNILEEREEEELIVGKELYGNSYDYRLQQNYHITLNSSLLSLEEEINILYKFIKTIY